MADVRDTPLSPSSRQLQQQRAQRTNRLITDVIIAVTIAALFTGIETRLGGARLRLFDPLAGLALLRIAQHIGLGALGVPRAMTFVLVMFAVHVISAFSWNSLLGVRELIQTSIILGFASAVVCYFRVEPASQALRLLALLILTIMTYSVVWHLSHGYMAGWKILNEPKVAFTLLPLVLCGWLFRNSGAITLTTILICAAGVMLVVLSGERKAYLLCAIFIVVVTGFSHRLFAAGLAGAILLAAAASYDTSGYISQQINAMLPLREPDAAAALDAEAEIRSISNFARQFSSEYGLSLFAEHPLTGTGTGRYKEIVDAQFPNLPEYLRIGLHGEFQRVLVENGLIGIAAYLAAWLFAVWRTFAGQRLNLLSLVRGLRGRQLMRVMLLSTFLVYCAFEGSTTISLLAFALAPFAGLLADMMSRGEETIATQSDRPKALRGSI